MSRKNQGLYILPPYGSSDQLYEGRIASLSGILPFLRNSREEYVILSDCHVVGNIDYSRLLEAHVASGAEVTVGYQRGASRGLKDGVILQVAPDGRIQDMRLGLCSLEACDYGLGLYVMKKEFLMRAVDEAVSRNRMNFERDVLQRRLEELAVYGYRVPEYAVPIDSLDAYFRANMALLQPEVRRGIVPHRPAGVHQGAGQLARLVRPPFLRDQFPGGGRRQYRGNREQLHYFPRCADRARNPAERAASSCRGL